MIYQKPQEFMISLKVLLRNSKGEFLILGSPGIEKYNPKTPYDLPGGRINDNEVGIDFHQLVRREIKEELGPKIKYKLRKDPVSLHQFRLKSSRCILYVLFEAEYLGGKIILSDEHYRLDWKKMNASNVKKYFAPLQAGLLINYFKWNYDASK